VRRGSTTRHAIEQVAVRPDGVHRRAHRDTLATEEPLEIRLVPAPMAGAPQPEAHPVAVTMRTPGHDFELAAGFLFAEGLIHGADQVRAIRYCVEAATLGAQQYNVVNVHLATGAGFDPATLRRNFYVTSSCGVCGKGSIEAVQALACSPVRDVLRFEAAMLTELPARLREAQPVFERTGGLHAAGLFTPEGELLRVREDVGRHNALDKLIGAALLEGELPLAGRLVLVSGRLSFELVQKAARAGASLLAGVSAPSSLAVELAREVGMTLVGFLRESTFNVYAGGEGLSS
jgi:FdhD protein